MKDKNIPISTCGFFSFFPLFILLLRASMMQKTSKDHNSQMVSSLEQPLLHTKLKEQFLKMVRVSATGMFSLTFKVGNLECKKGQLIGMKIGTSLKMKKVTIKKMDIQVSKEFLSKLKILGQKISQTSSLIMQLVCQI